ncbi:AP2-like ethylene-responsive transcription factor SMOS1 isoform X2 [Nymphaea colorata]|uniref:AP2-like ethylene-responsive transcription factor SMOS1 isoform X2 n=1 Tax=Nymphaea colorata TaxID=210225 RepID=UPI00129D4202|nr:AP2-like ethylene-responsive transcription factor SMOS1 isoform X2 [Nymphaea colorata]
MTTATAAAETSCEVVLKAEGAEGDAPFQLGEVKMNFHHRRQQDDEEYQHEMFRGLKKSRRARGSTAKERISRMPPCAAGKRSSIYRGVTRHRWTGRYEAHLWDKSSWNQNQNKKGKQVYLGAYDEEEAAARAYDLAALKYWGPGTLINFPISDYARDIEEMQKISREDYLASLRRKSSSCSRASSKYRGASRQSQNSQWDINLGQVLDNKYFGSGMCGTSADATTGCDYGSNFVLGRRIDLTAYIRWWKPCKPLGAPSTSKDSLLSKESKTLGWTNQHTEPYQLPILGVSCRGKPHTVVTACGILSQSSAFKYMREKLKARQEGVTSGYKITDSELNSVGKSEMPLEVPMLSTYSLQRNPYSVLTLPSTHVMGECSSIDPLADSILWSSIFPPAGLSLTATLQQSDPNSACTFYSQE